MLAMHKKLPAGPSKRLLFKYNTVNFVNKDICDGIRPVRRLPCRYRLVNPVKADI